MLSLGTSELNIRENLDTLAGSTGSAVQYDLGTIIGSFIGVALIVGALAALLYMVLAGIGWITAGGDTAKIGKARDRFIQSIVGLAVLAATWAVFLVVQYFFGINIGLVGRTGSGGSGGNGAGSGQVCQVGARGSDGGSGGYCNNGGQAMMQCFGPGQGASQFSYNHWEPCYCNPAGTERSQYNFDSC